MGRQPRDIQKVLAEDWPKPCNVEAKVTPASKTQPTADSWVILCVLGSDLDTTLELWTPNYFVVVAAVSFIFLFLSRIFVVVGD